METAIQVWRENRRLGDIATVGLLTLAALAIRLSALRSLPIFGDEAIFLRLAKLAREDAPGHLWSSLQVAYPPLHTWLLALCRPLSADPVRAGRLLSVFAGALATPAAAWTTWCIVDALAGDGRPHDQRVGRAAAAACALAAAVCPFFVFMQRLARVDALFLLETIFVAGASIRLCLPGSGEALVLRTGLAFGILMGLTMLTRQAVSYPLWLLPPLGWLLSPAQRRAPFGHLAARLAVGLAVGVAIWSPMLIAPGVPDVRTRIFFSGEMRPSMPAIGRAALAMRNLCLASESLWLYLSPPVVLAAAAALVSLTVFRRRRLLAFLVGWEAILMLPPACFAVPFFPRYALPAAFPVIVAASIGVSDVWLRFGARDRSRLRRWASAMVLAAAFCGWSLRDIARGEADWKRWPLLAIDRAQYVSGWSAGFSSELAVGFLEGEAQQGSITVLTPEFSGNPTDTVWLLLEGRPGVRLSYVIDALAKPLLEAVRGRPGTYRLRGDVRNGAPPSEVSLGADEPVYVVSMDPILTRTGWVSVVAALGSSNPGLKTVVRFPNPPDDDGRVMSSVVVLRVR